jgi:4-aminobutyrate aminotransferase
VIAREEVMKWEPGAHGSTFGGNPVCCAAALATLDLVEHGLMQNAATVGESLLAGLRALQQRHAVIGDVRGRGLMIAFELVKDRASKEPAPDTVKALVEACFRRGLLLLSCGPSSVRVAPPLLIDAEDVAIGLRILDECLQHF